MSVIVWDGTTLAADRQAVSGGRIYRVRKIVRIDQNRIAGFAGCMTQGLKVIEWLRSGSGLGDFPKLDREDDYCTVLLVERRGSRRPRLWRYESHAHPIAVRDRVHACGSGSDFAHGALALGASAREAVRVTIRLSADCGCGVDQLRLDDP